MVKNQAANAGDAGDLEEEMATHSGSVAWEIPWTEGPGGLQSMRVTESRTRLGN